VDPVGQLSDSRTEDYDFKVTPEASKDGSAKDGSTKDSPTAGEHVIVVRVYDRYDNLGAAKTVLRGK
ncbi:MAG TPA: hypothetical protein VFE27_11320, partial [Acidobacteriaceae bacterium]|nr:hypothetical protein [Acidobacteriaceae bacterium]